MVDDQDSVSADLSASTVILPEDILVEILARSAVKSLVRFYCISKPIYRLLHNPAFISDHRRHARIASTKSNTFSILFSGVYSAPVYSMSISGARNCGVTSHRPTHGTYDSFGWPYVLGSCRGLVYLNCDHTLVPKLGSSSSYFFWNPATRKTKLVQKTVKARAFSYGFGFDETNNDFKFIILGCHDPDRQNVAKYCSDLVEVYSLSSGSWTSTRFERNKILSRRWGHEYFQHADTINGVCYWISWKSECTFLVSYNWVHNDFEEIKLPQYRGYKNMSRHEKTYPFVTEYFGRLCVVWQRPKEFPRVWDFWVMDDQYCPGNGQVLWTKKFSLHPQDMIRRDLTRPVCFTRSGLLVWLTGDRGRDMVLSEPGSDQVFTIQLPVDLYANHVYEETLQQVDGQEIAIF